MFELLKDIRIVDLTTTFLGPYATQLLGDMGAEVVKVEALSGDVGRSPRPGRHPDMGAGFLNSNRNKHSLAVDLKTAEGREIVLRLCAKADALVHNMRPRAAERLGLSYEAVKGANPKIVYCFAPGFGQDGPYADGPAYDDIIQAMSGLADLNKDTSGAPRFFPSIVADKVMGLHLAFAVVAGLIKRLKTGEGALIETPMFESMVAFLMVEHLAQRTLSPAAGPAGYERLLAKNRRPFKTKDGYIAIMPYTTEQWTRFIESIGRQDLFELDWVRDPAKRSASVDALYQVIADAAPAKSTAEWLAILAELDIPCGRVNTLEELFAEPHLTAVGLFEEYLHPTEGRLTRARSPFRVQAGRQEDRPPPRVSQDSEAVLTMAGYSKEQIAGLIAKKIVRAG
jgi:crotonobetainyl-CoA:carnitine CoA-transferase CaiB-like acyl-CoA transferase